MLIANQLIGFAANQESYRYYRLNVSKVGDDGGGTHLKLRELRLYVGSLNKASGITPTSADTPAVGSLANLTNGDLSTANVYSSGALGTAGTGVLTPNVYFQFDLAAAYSISSIGITPEVTGTTGGQPFDWTVKTSRTGSFSGEEVTLLTKIAQTSGWVSGVEQAFSW